MFKRHSTKWIVVLVLVLLAIPVCAISVSHATCASSIVADLSVQSMTYTVFNGLAPSETWDKINGLAFWAIPLSSPPNYYCSVDATTGNTLRASLHALLAPHKAYPYTNASRPDEANHKVDTWDIIALADAYPSDSAKVLDIYQNHIFERQAKGSGLCNEESYVYDREHSWPKSYGFQYEPPDSKPWLNAAWTDCHHLFAAYCDYNRKRLNYPFASCSLVSPSDFGTDITLGRGGDSGDAANYRFDAVAGDGVDSWEVWCGRRGDVARALFYMAIRYEGGISGEANLELTDDRTKIANTEDDAYSKQSDAYMGLLSTLLQWHTDDPVDDLERRRNTVVYLFQGNRNPFVDHPEWVEVIFIS